MVIEHVPSKDPVKDRLVHTHGGVALAIELLVKFKTLAIAEVIHHSQGFLWDSMGLSSLMRHVISQKITRQL